MNLNVSYLGLQLPHPFIAGASPLSDTPDTAVKLEEAGCSAIVLRSLFEEQVDEELMASNYSTESHEDAFGEALSYFPPVELYSLGPDQYIDRVRKICREVNVPVIASLNGTNLGGWLKYSRMMEEAGASALELNLYSVPSDPQIDSNTLEQRSVDVVRELKNECGIPVSVKLSPFYTSLPNFCERLQEAGADGLVLFNRFYEPDIDIDELDIVTHLTLSNSHELLLRLRWLAILSPQLKMDMSVSGGVHTWKDAVKALMSGAQTIQLVSILLKQGPDHLKVIQKRLKEWLEEQEYSRLSDLVGCMNRERCPDPLSLERANYMRMLDTWEGLD